MGISMYFLSFPRTYSRGISVLIQWFIYFIIFVPRHNSLSFLFYNPNSVSLEWFLFSHRFLSLSLYFSRHTSFMLDFIFFFSRNYFCIHNPLIRLSDIKDAWEYQCIFYHFQEPIHEAYLFLFNDSFIL